MANSDGTAQETNSLASLMVCRGSKTMPSGTGPYPPVERQFRPKRNSLRSLGNSRGGGIVPKSVGMNAFLEAGALGGFLTCVPNGFRIDGSILAIVARK